MVESLSGGILEPRIRAESSRETVTMYSTHFHISPIHTSSVKVWEVKVGSSVPSALKTPSPRNDLH